MAIVLATPVFAAEKSDIEIVGKLGLNLNPKVNASGSFVDKGSFGAVHAKANRDVEFSLLIGAELFYYLSKNIAVGCGMNKNFNANLKHTLSCVCEEIALTNFYASIKSNVELQSKIFNSVYFIGQLGYGLFNFANHINAQNEGNGIYFSLG